MRDALPNATFVGFTGTPIESTDRDTRAVFGDYIDIYDIQRASRTARRCRSTTRAASRSSTCKRERDGRSSTRTFEEVTEGEERARSEKLKTKWAQLEALVGTEQAARR